MNNQMPPCLSILQVIPPEIDWKYNHQYRAKPEDFGITNEDAMKMRKQYLSLKTKNHILFLVRHRDLWYKHGDTEYYTYSNAISDLSRRLTALRSKKTKYNTFDLELIKEAPIGDYMPTRPIKHSHQQFYSCPFHEEKNASFVWYRDSNQYHCFSCGEHGDVINLVMKLNGISFIDACKLINPYGRQQ